MVIRDIYAQLDNHIGWLKPLFIGTSGVFASYGIQEWADATELIKNLLSIGVLLVTGLITIWNFIDKRKKQNDGVGSK